MADNPSQPDTIEVPVVWVDPPDPKAQWVNQFVSTFQPDEFIVTLGQVAPPPILGRTEQERRMALASVGFVPVHTVAKVALNRHRLEELIRVLQENLANHDAAVGKTS